MWLSSDLYLKMVLRDDGGYCVVGKYSVVVGEWVVQFWEQEGEEVN